MKRVITDDKMYDIASAIREKVGYNEPMDTNKMINALAGCSPADAFISGSMAEYRNEEMINVPNYAFAGGLMKVIDLPNAKTMATYSFAYCSELEILNLPQVRACQYYSFRDCTSLVSATFPSVTSINTGCFSKCTSLKNISLPSVTSLGSASFEYCSSLEWIDFSGVTSVPSLRNISAFKDVPSTCEFRVPAALVEQWKVATNWSTYAAQIIGV